MRAEIHPLTDEHVADAGRLLADRLRLVHANDSMDVRGAFKDRHQSIGDGYIGLGAFEELFAHPATEGVPFVLETPGSRDAGDPQIALLQKLRER
jgi:deoxyribonuclease-4